MPNSRTPCVRPRCKIEPYGLARKNSLVGIANRLSYQTYEVRSDKKTTWVTTDTDIIGVESCYIKQLGMDVQNFFKPEFQNNDSFIQLVKGRANEFIPVMEIKRRSEEREMSTLKGDDRLNALVPLTAPNQSIRRTSSKGVLSHKLVALMGSENVQEIDYTEVKEKVKEGFKRFSALRPNKVVKVDNRSMCNQKTRKISPELVLRASNRPMPKLATDTYNKKTEKIQPGNTKKCANEKSCQTFCIENKFIANRDSSIGTNLVSSGSEVSRNTSRTIVPNETARTDRILHSNNKLPSPRYKNKETQKSIQKDSVLKNENSHLISKHPKKAVNGNTGITGKKQCRWEARASKDRRPLLSVKKYQYMKKQIKKSLKSVQGKYVSKIGIKDPTHLLFLYLIFIYLKEKELKELGIIILNIMMLLNTIVSFTDQDLKNTYFVYREEFILQTTEILPRPGLAYRLEFNLVELLEKSKESLKSREHTEDLSALKKKLSLAFIAFMLIFTVSLLCSPTIIMWFQQVFKIIDWDQLKSFVLSLLI